MRPAGATAGIAGPADEPAPPLTPRTRALALSCGDSSWEPERVPTGEQLAVVLPGELPALVWHARPTAPEVRVGAGARVILRSLTLPWPAPSPGSLSSSDPVRIHYALEHRQPRVVSGRLVFARASLSPGDLAGVARALAHPDPWIRATAGRCCAQLTPRDTVELLPAVEAAARLEADPLARACFLNTLAAEGETLQVAGLVSSAWREDERTGVSAKVLLCYQAPRNPRASLPLAFLLGSWRLVLQALLALALWALLVGRTARSAAARDRAGAVRVILALAAFGPASAVGITLGWFLGTDFGSLACVGLETPLASGRVAVALSAAALAGTPGLVAVLRGAKRGVEQAQDAAALEPPQSFDQAGRA